MLPIKSGLSFWGGNIGLKNGKPNQIKMIIFNSSNPFLFSLNNTGRINIKIDGKGIGGLNISEYTQLIIPKGEHKIELFRLDLTYWKSEHIFFATSDPLIVEIWATPLSNDCCTRLDLSANFVNDIMSYKPVEYQNFSIKEKLSGGRLLLNRLF